MAACVLDRCLEQKTHHRSAEMMLAPAEGQLQRRQSSLDIGLAGDWLADPPRRARVRLVLGGCVQLCRVVHGRTLISKLLNTRCLRRWEMHHLYITDIGIHSKTKQGFMESAVLFSEIREVRRLGLWEATHKFCLGLVTPAGLLLLQLSSPLARDQWYHSILWKRRMCRHRALLDECRKPEALVREVKAMIDMCMQEPLLDVAIYQTPLDIVSGLLNKPWLWSDRLLREQLLCSLAPLLERLQPSRQLCQFLSRFCHDYPRSCLIRMRVIPVVGKILKHNVDFSKHLHARRLVQDLLVALNSQNGGHQATRDFISRIHGTGSTCPHRRVLPNLVAACLGAVFQQYEDCRRPPPQPETDSKPEPRLERLPEPEPELGSEPEPHLERQQEPEPFSKPEPHLEQQPEPEPVSQPSCLEPQSELKPEPRTESMSELPEEQRPCLRPEPASGPEEGSQPATQSRSQLVSPLESQPRPQKEVLSESVPEPEPESEPGRQPEPETEVEPEAEQPLPAVLFLDSERLHLFITVITIVSEYDDWRPGLALLLQPIPFPEPAHRQPEFVRLLAPVLWRVGSDPRCEVHKMVLATRPERDGWLELVCPSAASCPDDGRLWTAMLGSLLGCCSRRKAFLKRLLKVLGACQLMALRGDPTCQEVLCQMLEWGLMADGQQQRLTVSTLISTAAGAQRYRQLCERMDQLRELQSKGGPRVLSLPSRSTDHDLAQLLSAGCFGDLEALSLAFTSVTSQCAEQLIRLPNLRCLNLWCTQFGDDGLLLITEHLHKLEVLNLCETYVTDRSLPALAALKELRSLNLNSTELSAQTLAALRSQLPRLQQLDVRYTDAW